MTRTLKGCEIRFDAQFLDQTSLAQLTYHLPLQREPLVYSGVGLPTYFAGLLPEGLRLRGLVRKLKTSEDDLFSLLVAAGSDPVGDIHFEPEHDQTDLPEDFESLRKQIHSGIDSSGQPLAGVQDKISADRIALPIRLKQKGKSYILKLSSKNFSDLVENEMTCLSIAKKCGLVVNKSAIVQDKTGASALLVERFDHVYDAKRKLWIRHHQEDACQFLDRYPADKYVLTMQEIAAGVVQQSASPAIEVLNLLRLKAFSYLIGNGDLHGKNISLLQIVGEPSQLSPAYDIVCTALYGDVKMALEMDGKNQNLKRKNFVAFGQRFSVPAAATATMLDRLNKSFKKNLEMMFRIPLAKKKEKFLRQLFEERMKHLAG